MKEILFITPDDATLGFAMVGVRQLVIEPQGVEMALRQAMAEDTVGLIVLDERLLASLAEQTLQEMERHWSGVVTILPAPVATTLRDDYISRLVSRAIGYQVKLR